LISQLDEAINRQYTRATLSPLSNNHVDSRPVNPDGEVLACTAVQMAEDMEKSAFGKLFRSWPAARQAEAKGVYTRLMRLEQGGKGMHVTLLGKIDKFDLGLQVHSIAFVVHRSSFGGVQRIKSLASTWKKNRANPGNPLSSPSGRAFQVIAVRETFSVLCPGEEPTPESPFSTSATTGVFVPD
jgi:hypothetical protein